MGVVLERTSYTLSEEVAERTRVPLSKVLLIIKGYQNRLLLYIESGEKVPIAGLATIKVVHETLVFKTDKGLRSRQKRGDLQLNTTIISEEVSESLGFYKKETYLVIRDYIECLEKMLVSGKDVTIHGLLKFIVEDEGRSKTVRARISPSLRKKITKMGYENVYIRTSERIKELMYHNTVVK